jgi:hypothetical protein
VLGFGVWGLGFRCYDVGLRMRGLCPHIYAHTPTYPYAHTPTYPYSLPTPFPKVPSHTCAVRVLQLLLEDVSLTEPMGRNLEIARHADAAEVALAQRLHAHTKVALGQLLGLVRWHGTLIRPKWLDPPGR